MVVMTKTDVIKPEQLLPEVQQAFAELKAKGNCCGKHELAPRVGSDGDTQ